MEILCIGCICQQKCYYNKISLIVRFYLLEKYNLDFRSYFFFLPFNFSKCFCLTFMNVLFNDICFYVISLFPYVQKKKQQTNKFV